MRAMVPGVAVVAGVYAVPCVSVNKPSNSAMATVLKQVGNLQP